MDTAEEIENKIVVSLFNVLRSQTILNLNKSHKQERVQKTAPFPVERAAATSNLLNTCRFHITAP